MPSFEFADCPTRLPLTQTPEGDVQEGKLTCSVKSVVARRMAGRIKVVPETGTSADWFRIVGAPATGPRELELTFDANAVFSAEIAVKIPPGTQPQTGGFRLQVVSEQTPDIDFVLGPMVSFDIQQWRAPPKPAPKVPWWAFAIIGVLVLAILGALGWAMLPPAAGNPMRLVGKDVAKALTEAKAMNLPNPVALAGVSSGAKAGTVTSVAVAQNGDVTLYVDPGKRIISTPAVVSAAPGTIDLFAVGEDRLVYRKHFDGTAWSPALGWEPLGGWSISALSATASGGVIDVVAIGPDKAPLHRSFNTNGQASAAWLRMEGDAILDPLVLRRGDELNLFVIGVDSHMYRKIATAEFQSGPEDWIAVNGTFFGQPVGVSWGPDTLHVFGQGADRNLYIWWAVGASMADQWASLGGPLSSPVSVTSWAPGRLDIVGIGIDSGAYWKNWNGSIWLPSLADWTPLGGEFIDRPVIVTRGPGKLDIFAVGTDTQMRHKTGDGSGTWQPAGAGWDNLGGSFVGSPAAVVSGPDRVDVFALGADGTVSQMTLSGTSPPAGGYTWSRIDTLSTTR